jgi:hypothetical protein
VERAIEAVWSVRAIAANLADIEIAGDEAVPAAEVETYSFALDHLVLIAR